MIKDLLQLFFVFFRMGALTIGGGLVMLPLIHHTIVDDKKWLSEDEMIDCFEVCQALPGVIAINVATYIGNKRRGINGAIAASLGVIMPSFIIIIIASILLFSIGDNKYIEGAFVGIKAGVCGLIGFSTYRMAKKIIKDKKGIAIATGSLVSVVFFGASALWPIIIGAILGVLLIKEA